MEVYKKSGYSLRKSARTSLATANDEPVSSSFSSTEAITRGSSVSSSSSSSPALPSPLPPPVEPIVVEPRGPILAEGGAEGLGLDEGSRLSLQTETSTEPFFHLPLSRPITWEEKKSILTYVTNTFFDGAQELQVHVDQLLEKVDVLVSSAATMDDILPNLLLSLGEAYEKTLKQVIAGQYEDVDKSFAFGLLAIFTNKEKLEQFILKGSDVYRSKIKSQKDECDELVIAEREMQIRVQEIIDVVAMLHQRLGETLQLARDIASKLLLSPSKSSDVLTTLNQAQAALLDEPEVIPQKVEKWVSELRTKLRVVVQDQISPSIPDEPTRLTCRSRSSNSSTVAGVRLLRCPLCRLHTAGNFCARCTTHQCDSCIQNTLHSVYLQDRNLVKVSYYCAMPECKSLIKTQVLPISVIETSSQQA